MTEGEAPSAPRPTNSVTAVVVTVGRSAFLPKALAALAAQTRPADHVVLIDVAAGPDPAVANMAEKCGLHSERFTYTHCPGARNFGTAVFGGLLRLDQPTHDDWLWLVHDDVYPATTCLEQLIRAVERAPSVVIAGPKQHRADAPERLGEVGLGTTRFGRRVTGAEDGTLDQGQFDNREDVLGVGTAGMLIRRDTWEVLRGTDPALGPFGDGLDLSIRARLAGNRVIVVPNAIIDHEQASYRGLARTAPAEQQQTPDVARSYSARRKAAVYARMVAATAVVTPFIAIAIVVAGLGRAIGRIVTKELRLIPAEIFAPLAVLLRPSRISRGRRLAKKNRVLHRSSLGTLFISRKEARDIRRENRLARGEARRMRDMPSDLELREAARLRVARRYTAGALTFLMVVLSAAIMFSLVSSHPISGGALAPLADSITGLWDKALSPWLAQGLGHGGPADPFVTVLAVANTVSFGHGGVAIGALLFASPILAGWGAWCASGAAARSVAVRAWLTLGYFALPTLWVSLAQGRLGAVVAHAALPWVAFLIARGLGVDRQDDIAPETALVEGASQGSDRAQTFARMFAHPKTGPGSLAAMAGAGIVWAVAAAGAPVLLPLGILVVIGLAVFCHHRLRLILAVLPPVALFSQLIAYGIEHRMWRVFFVDPGQPLAFAPSPLWRQLLGWPVRPTSMSGILYWLAGAGCVLIVAAAVLAVFRRGARAYGIRLAWLAALAAIGTVGLAARIDIGVAGQNIVRAWPGSAISVLYLALAAAAAMGADGVLKARSTFSVREPQRHPFIAVVGAACIGLALTQCAIVIWQWHGPANQLIAARSQSQLPAIVGLSGTSPYATNTLLLTPENTESTEVTWDVVRGLGVDASDSAAVMTASGLSGPPRKPTIVADPDAESMAALVAHIAGNDTSDISFPLSRAGIGYIVVEDPHASTQSEAQSALVVSLDATAGIGRIAQTGTSIVWQVGGTPTQGSQGTGRLQVRNADGTLSRVLASSSADSMEVGLPAGKAGQTLTLAEPSDPGWQATLNGHQLKAVEGAAQQTFDLPATGGDLVVTYVWAYSWLGWVELAIFILAALIALPLPKRHEGEVT